MPNERSQVHTTEFLRGTNWINKRAMASGGNVSFSLKFQNGDLFGCPKTDSLAHCVSRDLKMGKGIAVIFKKKFGQVDSLKRQGKKVGEVAYIEKDGRYIYYLITKEKANDKPTYDDFKQSLQYMKKHCVFAKVAHLSMPRIGCGLDRLEWSEVEQILRDIFWDTNITITIYDLPQKEAEVKHDEKSHPNGDEKTCPKDEMVSSKYVKALKADEKNLCIEDEKASLRKDEVPPKRNEDAPSKEDEKAPYKGDEKLLLKRDKKAHSKGDKNALSKGDEKPSSKRDEKPSSKTDEKVLSKGDEQPSSKRDEKPSSKRDEKVPSKKGEKAAPEGKT